MRHVGDITKLDGALLVPVDVICGGSPCQDLSVAGARAGLAGERSSHFLSRAACLGILRRARERGKELPPQLKAALEIQAGVTLGGCFVDMMAGQYHINLLQHIFFLKDVFRTYKDFTDAQIDTIEILLSRLYAVCGIGEDTLIFFDF